MFYRRKIILALLQVFGGELEKIRLQKLLFLLTKRQQKPEYEFIPYKFGCFSYSANADLTAMAGRGILVESETHFKYAENEDYIKSLKDTDRTILQQVKGLYGALDSNALMVHTYNKYPYYAINSLKAPSILSTYEFEKVRQSKPQVSDIVLFTIGYEGISLEAYLNKLIKNDVKILADVRCNPLSMKYGFSKGQLKKYCDNLGIQYLHFPELGISSEHRQQLDTQQDYDKLFEAYRGNLPTSLPTQLHILELLKQHKRIALTCFEANICQCHRKHLAEAIEMLPEFKYVLKHI